MPTVPRQGMAVNGPSRPQPSPASRKYNVAVACVSGDNELSATLATRATLNRLTKDAAKQVENVVHHDTIDRDARGGNPPGDHQNAEEKLEVGGGNPPGAYDGRRDGAAGMKPPARHPFTARL
jgi:hypothetical protein